MINRFTFMWHFASSQLAISWLVGRKNFDGAIRAMEKFLSRIPDDLDSTDGRKETIWMIAECHRGAHRNDEAIAAAKRVLALDGRHHETNKLLSEIYFKRSEHDLAAVHARIALESSRPVIKSSKWMWRLFGWMTSVHPDLRRFTMELEKSFAGQSEEDVAWHGWAVRYLAWYHAQHGTKEAPTLH